MTALIYGQGLGRSVAAEGRIYTGKRAFDAKTVAEDRLMEVVLEIGADDYLANVMKLDKKADSVVCHIDDGKANAFSFALIDSLHAAFDRAAEAFSSLVEARRRRAKDFRPVLLQFCRSGEAIPYHVYFFSGDTK